MAYFYPSNHPENLGNYQYNDQYYYNYNHDYNNQEPRYVQYSDSEFYGNAYQQALTPSLVGYYYSNYSQPESVLTKDVNFGESGDYYDHVSTQYVVSYNNTTPAEAEAKEATDVVSEENDPNSNSNSNSKPFHGGYDIHEKYGKPLPPSEDICYPTSKIDPNNNVSSVDDFSYGSVPSPYVEGVKNDFVGEGEPKQTNGVIASKVIQEEDPSDFEDDEEEGDEEDDDEKEDEEKGGGEEKHDGLVSGAMINEVEPKQTNGIIPSKVIQEENPDFGKEPSKDDPIVPFNDAVHAKEEQNIEGEAKPKNESVVGEVIQEEKASDFEDSKEEEEEEEEEIEGDVGDEGRKEEEYGNQIRRQIPPGYGMEAIDLCEGVFGGYFPCLWKRNQRIYNHQRDVNDKMSDYDYCWKETAEYLFGNPNPYGGTMPEKGSYGDPVYSYHRHYPQQPLTEQVEYHGGSSSWVHHSRNYYGHNGGSTTNN